MSSGWNELAHKSNSNCLLSLKISTNEYHYWNSSVWFWGHLKSDSCAVFKENSQHVGQCYSGPQRHKDSERSPHGRHFHHSPDRSAMMAGWHVVTRWERSQTSDLVTSFLSLSLPLAFLMFLVPYSTWSRSGFPTQQDHNSKEKWFSINC